MSTSLSLSHHPHGSLLLSLLFAVPATPSSCFQAVGRSPAVLLEQESPSTTESHHWIGTHGALNGRQHTETLSAMIACDRQNTRLLCSSVLSPLLPPPTPSQNSVFLFPESSSGLLMGDNRRRQNFHGCSSK